MNHLSFRTALLGAAFGLLATQAIPSFASPSDPSSGNLSAASGPSVSAPINQGASKSFVGVWTLSYDWGCTGTPGTATWDVSSDSTYSDNFGGSGTWHQNGKKVTLTYNGGGASVYAGKQVKNTASGTMSSGGTTGCWTATR